MTRMLLPWVLLLLAGCGDTGPEAATDPVPDPTTGSASQSPGATTGPSPRPTTGQVDRARADLAERLDVPLEDVEVISSEEVTWPDGALGCPREGMFYPQATVPGTRTVLQVDGTRYAYHAAAGREPFHCPDPTPPVGTGPTP